MDEEDFLEAKFRSSFAGFEKEPPGKVWENLSRELHPEPVPGNILTRIASFSVFSERRAGFYLTAVAVVITLLLVIIYFGSTDRHAIRGHAYTGETRLCKGTAVLFKVTDKAMPWDSVTQYRSSVIDNDGRYQFSKVENGQYLLRIVPEGNTEASVRFQPSWYDQHGNSDSCHLIILNKEDINADVHLMMKSENTK